MGSRISTRRLIGSALLASAIIGFALLSNTSGPRHVIASNTDDLLKALASKDSDGDGLLDWEESLYGTDPQNQHSIDATLTDAEAVAQGKVSIAAPKAATSTPEAVAGEDVPVPDPASGSFTEHFADFLFTEYASRIAGTNPSDAEKKRVITDIVSAFSENTDKFFVSRYTFNSLTVSTDADLTTYVGAVESLFTQKGTGLDTSDPTTLISAAIENDDAAAKEKLIVFARFYASLANALAKTTVPSSVADAHLALVQSFDRFSIALAAIGHVDADPLISLAVLPLFDSEPSAATDALGKIVTIFTRAKGTPQSGEPGYILRSLSVQTENL